MTANGLRRPLAALPFAASLVLAAVAVGIEARGQLRMGPAEWRIERRAKDVPMRTEIASQDPREVEAARDALPFDAQPRRWLAWIFSGGESPQDGPLARAIAEGLDRRPRDPVLLFLAGEMALRAGDEMTSNRLRLAAIDIGPYEAWMIDRFAEERLETGRTHEAAGAGHRERARALSDALDADGAGLLRHEADRERDDAKRCLSAVVALGATLASEVRSKCRIDALAAEAAKDLADLAEIGRAK